MDIFVELSLVIVAAAVIAGIMRILKQPLIIGYILTGVILGPYFLNVFSDRDSLSVFANMGIAILLFIVGLHLSPKEIKNFGVSAFIVGVLQIVFTTLLGSFVTYALGFSIAASIYIGVGLAFSSTIIVLKLISDKKELETLYGRIAVGILLLQDIVAAVALIFASSLSSGSLTVGPFLVLLGKGIFLTIFVILLSYFLLPKLATFFAKSQEYLFLFSIAWGLGLASLFSKVGFSLEIGALIAGVGLSLTPYNQEISARLRPLRDFFVIIFFILLGAQLEFSQLQGSVIQVIVLLVFVLIAKPVLIVVFMEMLGYNKKTSFLAANALDQISEFSLILVFLGYKLGHVDMVTVSVVTMVGILSITFSTYTTIYSEFFYKLQVPFLKIFERKRSKHESSIVSSYDVILFGCNRVGYDFINVFKKLGSGFLAVDFDPDLLKELRSSHINCEYGDADDPEFFEDINATQAKVLISTIPVYETNEFIVQRVREKNANALIVVLSHNIDKALKLYELGASYVILPHFLSGEVAAKIVEEAHLDHSLLGDRRNRHIEYLKERKHLGHRHPTPAHH
jgi:Kef-type K+ transport system membrane component KefB/Trk K+ transport system NAD-binding subunit